ncbi:MAG: DUF624 domain-containing protein [Clostridiales bacterium]|nr:DUF624 domain-containing protein [Clostridiales bacterium]
MGWYKKQFENDLDARNENKEEQVARHDPLSGLWTRMFLDNLKLLVTLLPFLFLFTAYMITGVLIFFVGAMLLLSLAGPAVSAQFDFAYTVARDDPASTGRTFLQSYRLNFKQGTLFMLLVSLMITPTLLTMIYVAPTESATPMMTATLMLISLLVIWFAHLGFSQIALLDMPLGKIIKNAVFLIPISKWKGLLVALLSVLYLIVLYSYMERAVLTLAVYIPTLLIVFAARLFWPLFEELIIVPDEETENKKEDAV